MRRVVSLFLPHLAIERLRRQERTAKPLLERTALQLPVDDDPGACSVPRGGGWRPGALGTCAADARRGRAADRGSAQARAAARTRARPAFGSCGASFQAAVGCGTGRGGRRIGRGRSRSYGPHRQGRSARGDRRGLSGSVGAGRVGRHGGDARPRVGVAPRLSCRRARGRCAPTRSTGVTAIKVQATAWSSKAIS